MTPAIIGIGANLENPQEQVRTAIDELATLTDTTVSKVSSLYSTAPVGPQDQPNFINAVAIIETKISAHSLLDELQALEQRHRRVRKIHWGPRTLDLDILFYGQEKINDDRLVVPHKEILNRAFVIIPLLEIAPDMQTLDGIRLDSYIASLPAHDLTSIKKLIV